MCWSLWYIEKCRRWLYSLAHSRHEKRVSGGDGNTIFRQTFGFRFHSDIISSWMERVQAYLNMEPPTVNMEQALILYKYMVIWTRWHGVPDHLTLERPGSRPCSPRGISSILPGTFLRWITCSLPSTSSKPTTCWTRRYAPSTAARSRVDIIFDDQFDIKIQLTYGGGLLEQHLTLRGCIASHCLCWQLFSCKRFYSEFEALQNALRKFWNCTAILFNDNLDLQFISPSWWWRTGLKQNVSLSGWFFWHGDVSSRHVWPTTGRRSYSTMWLNGRHVNF